MLYNYYKHTIATECTYAIVYNAATLDHTELVTFVSTEADTLAKESSLSGHYLWMHKRHADEFSYVHTNTHNHFPISLF